MKQSSGLLLVFLGLPRQTLAFPSSITPAQLAAAAPQRSRGRLPALVWLHPTSKAPLVRSSQPMAGMTTKVGARGLTGLDPADWRGPGAWLAEQRVFWGGIG